MKKLVFVTMCLMAVTVGSYATTIRTDAGKIMGKKVHTPTVTGKTAVFDSSSTVTFSGTLPVDLMCPDGHVIKSYSSGVFSCISSSIGGGAWGSITGALADQADLNDALDAKQDYIGYVPAGMLTFNAYTSVDRLPQSTFIDYTSTRPAPTGATTNRQLLYNNNGSIGGFANYSNGFIGLGKTPTVPIDIVTTAVNPITVQRTTSGTNYLGSLFKAEFKTSGQMADGFGAQTSFSTQDADGVSNLMGAIAGVRAGDDSSGATNMVAVYKNAQIGVFRVNPLGQAVVNARLDSYAIPDSEFTVQPKNVNSVIYYNGSGYVNNTTEANTSGGTPFPALAATSNYLYITQTNQAWSPGGVYLDFATFGAGVTLAAEYYNGSAWTALSITDGTSNMTQNGNITFTAPTDAAAVLVNGATRVWLRLKTTSAPSVTPTINYITTDRSNNYLFAVKRAEGDTVPTVHVNKAGQVTSTVATGTAPLVIASTTNIPNLNADTVDGHHWSEVPVMAAPGAIGVTTPAAITGTTIKGAQFVETPNTTTSTTGSSFTPAGITESLYAYTLNNNATITLPTTGLPAGVVTLTFAVTGASTYTLTWTTATWIGSTPPATPANGKESWYTVTTRNQGAKWTGFYAGVEP